MANTTGRLLLKYFYTVAFQTNKLDEIQTRLNSEAEDLYF